MTVQPEKVQHLIVCQPLIADRSNQHRLPFRRSPGVRQAFKPPAVGISSGHTKLVGHDLVGWQPTSLAVYFWVAADLLFELADPLEH
jgi:hypothetical protein